MTSILVVAPSWVGDALLSQPMLTRLKQRDPQARIDILAPGWALPIFRRMPEVSDALESPFGHGELALGKRWRIARSLRANRYDRAFVLPNSFKSALIPMFAGIPERIGFIGELRHGLLTDARRLDARTLPLMVERFAWLADAADAGLKRPVPRPKLRVSQVERSQLRERLGLGGAGRVACFCPGAEYGPSKRWPAQYYGELAQRLGAEGYMVWLVGSAKERDIGDAISGTAPDAVNLCGRTTLDDAVVLLSCADLVVSNDSGLMHVAAALDRPMIALYGSSSSSFTPPLSDRAHVVKHEVPCSPCFQRVCPLKHFDCMIKLAPSRVLDEIHRNFQT
ncbi:MAG TPA: lipopolysaccharide heptosyltransferase II [Burkholderiales bacterium]|nr:lipopolysaccharide heptosyltransferase II [Burkholderiales bacterium]